MFEQKKLDLDKEYELDFHEQLADLEWNLYSSLLDKFCMLLYVISFIGVMIFFGGRMVGGGIS